MFASQITTPRPTNTSPLLYRYNMFLPAAARISREMMGAFLSLAKTGSPDHAGLTGWPQYRIPARETMVFGTQTEVMRDPRGVERALFAKVPFIQWGS